jgi:hypothetical protein
MSTSACGALELPPVAGAADDAAGADEPAAADDAPLLEPELEQLARTATARAATNTVTYLDLRVSRVNIDIDSRFL